MEDLAQVSADFWYHALWTAKKLRRGELWTATQACDGYMKERLLWLLRWHARAIDPSRDVWHGARFVEQWADPAAVGALRAVFARYDARDVAGALRATMDLFERVERETAHRLGHAAAVDVAEVRRRVENVLGTP